MPDKDINKPKTTPKGQVDKEPDEIKDMELSHEELKKKVMEESKKLEIEPVEPKPEVEEEPTEIPTEPTEIEKETWEQKYDNLRKLQSSQTDELGELRKKVKETEELREKTKEYQITSTKDHILRQVEEMKPEEREKFYEKFSESPDKALTPLISKLLSPFMVIQAGYKNEMAVSKLRNDTKDSIIPYERYENEIDEILNTNKNGINELFYNFGSGAFEKAYDMVYKKHIKEETKKEKEEIMKKAKKEAEEDFNKKKNTFTEPQGKSSASQVGKPINLDDLSYEELAKKVGKPNDD